MTDADRACFDCPLPPACCDMPRDSRCPWWVATQAEEAGRAERQQAQLAALGDWLTINEAAARLHVARSTVEKRIREGTLLAVRLRLPRKTWAIPAEVVR